MSFLGESVCRSMVWVVVDLLVMDVGWYCILVSGFDMRIRTFHFVAWLLI